jgi:hypothetical protein
MSESDLELDDLCCISLESEVIIEHDDLRLFWSEVIVEHGEWWWWLPPLERLLEKCRLGLLVSTSKILMFFSPSMYCSSTHRSNQFLPQDFNQIARLCS